MKKTVILCAVVGAAALIFMGATADRPASTNAAGSKAPAAAAKAPSNVTDLFADKVVARGKGVSVTRGEMDQSLVSIKANAAASGQPIPQEYMPLIERQLLQQLIGIQVLNAQATEADKAAGAEQAQKSFEQFRTISGTEEAFERQLTLLGISRDQLLAKLKQEAIAEAVIKRELKTSVPDEEVKKFYDDNPAEFEQPEMVRAAHVLLMTQDPTTRTDLPEDKKAAKRKQIEDLLKRARAGEDFAALAKEYSEDPGSKASGGEYTFGRGKMVPAFEQAAFSLKTNEVSDVVTTPYGYHIIKLYEKTPAQKAEFAKVSPKIKEFLERQAVQKQIPDYLKKLEKDAGVEILDEKLKPVETPTNAGSGDATVKPAASATSTNK